MGVWDCTGFSRESQSLISNREKCTQVLYSCVLKKKKVLNLENNYILDRKLTLLKSEQNPARFTAEGLLQGRDAGLFPKPKQLEITAWSFLRGPRILHLLRFIFFFLLFLAWERLALERMHGSIPQAHSCRAADPAHDWPIGIPYLTPSNVRAAGLWCSELCCWKVMVNKCSIGQRKHQQLLLRLCEEKRLNSYDISQKCVKYNKIQSIRCHHWGLQCAPIKGQGNAFFLSDTQTAKDLEEWEPRSSFIPADGCPAQKGSCLQLPLSARRSSSVGLMNFFIWADL